MPSNIAPDSVAVRCHVKSASGVETVVVLGKVNCQVRFDWVYAQVDLLLCWKINYSCNMRSGRRWPSILYVYSSGSLLPPFHQPQQGVRRSNALVSVAFRSSATVAGGTPVVDALVVTSVWAVHVLRGLCQDPSYRGLVSLGIAGVGGNALVHFKPSDTLRYNTIVTGPAHIFQRSVASRDASGMQNRALVPRSGGHDRFENEVAHLPRPRTEPRVTGQNGDIDVDFADSTWLYKLNGSCVNCDGLRLRQ